MTNRYFIYILTLLSAYITFILCAGTFIFTSRTTPSLTISLYSSYIQFLIGSSLFLHWPKTGRWVAVIMGISMLAFPVAEALWSIKEGELRAAGFSVIPIMLSALVIYGHVKNMENNDRPSLLRRIVLTLLPIALFIYFFMYDLK